MISLDISGIEAAIFDIDGTMVDNMAIHKEAWKRLCANQGRPLSDADFDNLVAGLGNEEIFKNLFPDADPALRPKFQSAKEAIYRELYRPVMKEVSGLTALLDKLAAYGIKLAVATASPESNRDFVINGLGLRSRFAAMIGNDDVKRAKPDPEVYLKAAAAVGVDPVYCLAFEDSPVGIRAAKAAGIKVVGLTTFFSSEDLAEADWIVSDFSSVELYQS